MKLWTQAWLRGNISNESLATKAIFAGLLAIAGDSVGPDEESEVTGIIRLGPNNAYSDEQIAKLLKVAKETWLTNKNRLEKIKLIEVSQSNEIMIVKWDMYQADYVTRQLQRRGLSAKASNDAERSRSRSKKKETDEEEEKDNSFCGWYKMLLGRWNEEVAKKYDRISPVLRLSASRKEHLKARYGEPTFTDNLDKMFSMIHASPKITDGSMKHPQGADPWTISFDWFIKNDLNYIKLLEGKYEQHTEPDPYAELYEHDPTD